MGYALRFDGSEPFDLHEISTLGDPKADRDDGEKDLDKLVEQIGELQSLLYAADANAVLIVLQGMDTSGKDGVIRKVLDDVDAQGVQHDLAVLANYESELWYLGDNRLTQDPEDALIQNG